MAYFKNVKSFEDLKNQFKSLARANHPDCGGDAEVMKEINAEFDQLFPIWKHRHNVTSDVKSTETADSTRSEFYTQNGWKGSNYSSNRTLKEIAAIVRKYVKETYPTYKFSVRTEYASMCQELHVDLKESPVEIYKSFDELTEEDKNAVRVKAAHNGYFNLNSWNDAELKAEFERIWEEHGNFYKAMNEVTKAVVDDVDAVVNSYNYSDCDGMIDYFDVNFYYFGCAQNNGKDIKIVPKTARIKKQSTTPAKEESSEEQTATAIPEKEYEITESEHTKTHEKIFVVKVLRTLTREEYLQVKEHMKAIGGYYSKFVHGFIFKENPVELLAS